VSEIIDATVELARQPGRLIFTYFPSVDVAAHMTGQRSEGFADALDAAASIWQRIVDRLPESAVAVGTADHGLIDYSADEKILIRDRIEGITFHGNPRTSYIRGPAGVGERLAAEYPATWAPWENIVPLLGPGPLHPAIEGRAPDGLLVADPGYVLWWRIRDTSCSPQQWTSA
jgi:predicted AlkP superfamily pyrophosphatase or phosphodiesterase